MKSFQFTPMAHNGYSPLFSCQDFIGGFPSARRDSSYVLSLSAQNSNPSESLFSADALACPVTASERRAISTDLIGFRCFSISHQLQTPFCQPGVMKLANLYNQVGIVIASKEMIAFNAEGADFPWWTYLLAGVTKDGFRFAPYHRSPPTLAYKFSIFKTSASAISRIVPVSAKTSLPAMRTPRHLASNLATLSFPRSSFSRSL